MINTKQEFSQLCQHIHLALRENGHNIKLASVREITAQAYQVKSAAALLSQLPIEFEETFTNFLNDAFKTKHRIDNPFILSSFPFPIEHVLSENELSLIWNELRSSLVTRMTELTDENLNPLASLAMLSLAEAKINLNELAEASAPEGLKPDGKRGWYCKKPTPVSNFIKNIRIEPIKNLITGELA
jgi:hypothetical protein